MRAPERQWVGWRCLVCMEKENCPTLPSCPRNHQLCWGQLPQGLKQQNPKIRGKANALPSFRGKRQIYSPSTPCFQVFTPTSSAQEQQSVSPALGALRNKHMGTDLEVSENRPGLSKRVGFWRVHRQGQVAGLSRVVRADCTTTPRMCNESGLHHSPKVSSDLTWGWAHSRHVITHQGLAEMASAALM
jgi:hypothetical protein